MPRSGLAHLMVPLLLAAFGGCQRNFEHPQEEAFCPAGDDLAAWVDPFIGTRGSGNAIPAAQVPHGMVKLSPDSLSDGGSVGAYDYNDTRLQGFSHLNLQGPGGGANGYGQILLLPTTGPIQTDTQLNASAIDHAREQASPGNYSVDLLDYGVSAELTATGLAGFHRYTFPAVEQARVLIDLGHSRGESRGGQVEIVGDDTIRGQGAYNVHPLINLLLSDAAPGTGDSKVYFHAVFDPPFETFGTWQTSASGAALDEGGRTREGARIGAWAGWAFAEQRTVEVRVGISVISADQARANLEAEIGEATFEQVSAAARAEWNCLLNRVRISGASDRVMRAFYTALYHAHFAPADYTEAGGRFHSAADGVGQVFEDQPFHFYTDDWCAWDTYRTSRPLTTLVEPEVVDDVVSSYLHLYRQGGWLPKCTWHAAGYSRVMIGNHGVPILADAVTKGFDGFDTELAWEAAEHAATVDDNPLSFQRGLCGYFNLGTVSEYMTAGYVSTECDPTQSVSMTLEYAYDDWTTARMAEALDRLEDRVAFDARAGNWRNHWDPDTGFMRGRHSDGSWVEPLDPGLVTDFNDFCEASAWIYTWFVPHDVDGLIEVMGGRQAFVDKLAAFFDQGHFDPSNEPSFHAPWLFNRAGAPEQTQARVQAMLTDAFTTAPDGLPGNDDAGATSAWYVFGALGLFPLAPGDGRYEISTPLVERAALRLHPAFHAGREFVIEAPRAGPDHIYIQAVTLNGEPLERTWITHAEITAGGVLHLELGPTPGPWGRAE